MSDISSKDIDFKKPKDVNGSDGDNLSVAGHPDNNTTNRSVHGDSDTSSSSSSNGSSSSSNSSSGNTNGSSQSSSGNALTRLFNLNAILMIKHHNYLKDPNFELQNWDSFYTKPSFMHFIGLNAF